MRRPEPLGGTVTALFVAGHLAAYTLLGMTIVNDADGSQTTAAAPDTPLSHPDPPPEQGTA